MRLYSYVVTHDTGFSPNPFWGYCTLANCKPAIRRTAHVGDWVVGIAPKARRNRLIYAMRVDEILSYAEYFRDSRFARKIPDYDKTGVVHRCGDNIYRPLGNGLFEQLRSMHSNGKNENARTKAHDLNGHNVLISRHFYYFGSDAGELPPQFESMKVGRAHKCRFPSALIAEFLEYMGTKTPGVRAQPTDWPGEDGSWKARCS